MKPHRQDPLISVPQARAIEEGQPELRVELIDGAVYGRGRGTPWHAMMTAALAGTLRTQLRRPCRAAAESIAVGITEDESTYVHPDVAVVCGPLERHPEEPTVVMNPRAVFEVLSKGTAMRDLDTKLPKYKAIPSVDTIVYVDHAQRRFTAWLRTEQGWEQVERGEGELHLRKLDVTLDVGALYDEVAEDAEPES